MKKILLLLVFLLSLSSVSASKYFAPTDEYTNKTFSASSLELADVLADGQDLGNTTTMQFSTIDGFKLALKIDNTKDANLKDLKIKFSADKTIIDKGSSNFDLYTLYVSNSNNGKGIYICPQAKNLDEINKQCPQILKIFEPFPHTVFGDTPISVEIVAYTEILYSASGLKSGGIGLLSSDDKPDVINGPILPPSINIIFPKNSETVTDDFTFKCKGSSENGLKSIDLYTDLTGSMQLTYTKQTSQKQDILEYKIKKPLNGKYNWYCKITDNSNQQTQSSPFSFSVQESKSTDCVEDWICTPLQPLKCAVGHKTRTCTDRNNCGTTKYKPEEAVDCQSKCSEDWSCSGWLEPIKQCGTRTCTDRNQCGNSQYQISKPNELKDCLDQTSAPISFENNGLIVVVIVLAILVLVIFVLRKKKPLEEADNLV